MLEARKDSNLISPSSQANDVKNITKSIYFSVIYAQMPPLTGG